MRKEEVPPQWELVPGPQLRGVGGDSRSEETKGWLKWRDMDGTIGNVRPLVAAGLTANLLGQDILGEAEAYITTDHKALYQDILEEEECQQQFNLPGSFSNYRGDPLFEDARRKATHIRSHPRGPNPQS